ncbi:DUF4270 domain-containing protein [Pelobium sp.]|nr:DUF4270 domain-containing protein [Pelobium sp.]MDA9554828.1 DUF4270 domain-containing protein [Pelobium sp.]
MKFIKSGLLTLLVSLFILGGCKNPSGVGLDVDSDIAINSKVIDTSTVTAKLLKIDSVITNGTNRSALGYFKDPTFGTTTSNIAVALTLPTSNYTFGKNPVLDSAVLVLPFAGFYGDSLNTNYTAEVRQLNEVLYSDSQKPFYNTKKWQFNSTVIGSKNFSARYKDSITIQDIVVAKKDTVKRVPAQLRIPLDPTFITNNILKTDSLNLLSNKVFNNYFKGLYISLNKNTTTNNGGIFLFDTFTANAAKLDLFYKKTSTTGTIDTVSTSLAIAGSSGDAVSEISWDVNGTPVQNELQSTSKTSNNLYLQGLTGTQVRIDFPYLSKLKALGPNININRAELIVKVVNGTETPYNPVARLRAYRWDIAERPQLIPDDNQRDPRSIIQNSGLYDTKTKSYIFNMTGYIQDLLNGRTKNYGTFISSTDFLNGASVLTEAGRSVVGGGNPNFKIQLKIYYTDLK